MKRKSEKYLESKLAFKHKKHYKKVQHKTLKFSRIPVEVDKPKLDSVKSVDGLNETRRKLEAALGLLKLKGTNK